MSFGSKSVESLFIGSFDPAGNSDFAYTSHSPNLRGRATRKNHIYCENSEMKTSFIS